MSRKLTLAWLTALLVTLSLAPVAWGQVAHDIRAPGEIRSPFIEPDYFDPDYQFFAPADVEKYDDEPEYAVGWFFTYDRAYMNVSRGSQQLRPWDGDFTWGNRYEMGYMTNDDHGWLMTIWHIDGASTSEGILQESGDADITSFELCKSWRRHLHNGTILEPFCGFRYGKLEEDFFNSDPVIVANVQVGTNDFFNHTENNMVGGVFGGRLTGQHGHWVMSTDARIYAAYNFQYNEFNVRQIPTDTTLLTTSSIVVNNYNQFVLGGDINATAQYIITRDVSLNFGFSMTYYGRGVGRINISSPDNNAPTTLTGQYQDDQFLMAVGYFFGLAINR